MEVPIRMAGRRLGDRAASSGGWGRGSGRRLEWDLGGTQRACVTRCKSAIQESVPLVEVTASLKLSRAPYFVCVMHDKREESPETAHAIGNRMEKRVTGSFTGLKKLIKCEKKEKRAATRSNDKLEDSFSGFHWKSWAP